MKKKVFVFAVVFMFFLSSCENSLRKDLQDSIHQIKAAAEKFPEPRFDKELKDILTEYKEKYQAKGVRIGRPFMYSSEGDSSYWLRVEFLNPALDDKTFSEFGKDVALNTLSQLVNDQDFEKIEVSVTSKKGFIITFSSTQNAFFYRDSLQVTSQ